jgi:hypothetical protein
MAVALLTVAVAAAPSAVGAQEGTATASGWETRSTGAVSAVTVAIDPETSTKEVGAAFDVALRIEGAEDLALFDFDLTYDPDVVSVSDIEEGGFLSSGGQGVFTKGPEYPVTGTVTYAAAIFVPQPEGVDGSGDLAVLHLEALSVGTSPLTLAEVRLWR